jgi:riboflavin biosynthesis pyrimidine reductase
MSQGPDFRAFAEKKMRAVEQAVILPLRTVEDRSHAYDVRRVGNAWTRLHYDGDFHLFNPPPDLPAVSMVFVQSRDGNTVTTDPATLGGGPTDMHVIYEGLSRVAVDGVLAGARTVGMRVFFTLWHPEVVALRKSLGLPRHPAQVVLSQTGRINLDALLFNVPEVPVFLILGEQGMERWTPRVAGRPWITIVPLSSSGLRETFRRLRREHGLSRISVVGGRTVASALIDAGLAQDLCLTTSAVDGGEPGTPFYAGSEPPTLEPVVRKECGGDRFPIRFEHFAVAPRLADSINSKSTVHNEP